MADSKITQLNELTAPLASDILPIVDDPAGSAETKKITIANLFNGAPVILGLPSALTIASGEITVVGSYHRVDTEGSAASDDLDTINGGSDGQILYLQTVNSGRDVTLKDGGGNLILAGDMTLDTTSDIIHLIHYNGNWREVSRSNNA